MSKKLCATAVAVGALVWAAPAMATGGGGGPGALQAGIQQAVTDQSAGSAAISNQNAVNANVPVSIAGGRVSSGPSSATQNADSNAKAKASNDAETNQTQTQTQNVGGSSCAVGCGGAGAAQIGAQLSDTEQGAKAIAVSDQNAVNANVPVSIAGGNVSSGSSSADQTAKSKADAKAKNDADANQTQTQNQTVGGGSSCAVGCGGAGAAQIGAQLSKTEQGGEAKAISKQNAVNANVPVSIAGGDVKSGSSSAQQNADSSAKAKTKNDADTTQTQNQTQNVGGSSSCKAGCGGAGGFQAGVQAANTEQWADSKAISDQNAVNANVPVSIAGRNVSSGSSSADQTANSEAQSKATNDADTTQHQTQNQNVGGSSSCVLGCGGPGAAQIGIQKANTEQWADSKAIDKQNAVNANSPVNTAGGNIYAGSSSADQTANSEAKSKASNDADTRQGQEQTQNVGSSRDCKCGHDYVPRAVTDGRDCGCDAGSGGAGGFQAGVQLANTRQWADSKAISKQNAVNGNSAHNTAGGDIRSGPSSATQNADSRSKSKAKNEAGTCQIQNQTQNAGSGRARSCGSDGKKGYDRKQGHDRKKGHGSKGSYDRKDVW